MAPRGTVVISLTESVDEHVDLLHEDRPADGLWHPSSYWGCARRAIYEVRGEAPSDPHDAATKRRFVIGNIIHDFVRAAVMTDPGVVGVDAEFAIEGESEHGHGDLMLELDDDTFLVIEVKSMSKMRKLADKDLHQAIS
jgi:hypothetical protein